MHVRFVLPLFPLPSGHDTHWPNGPPFHSCAPTPATPPSASRSTGRKGPVRDLFPVVASSVPLLNPHAANLQTLCLLANMVNELVRVDRVVLTGAARQMSRALQEYHAERHVDNQSLPGCSQLLALMAHA
jgi:hypothetical protein